MITHRGFSAWITSEDKPLPIYQVAVDRTTNKVYSWIPSETGKTFKVHWRDEGSGAHSCAFVYLDGFAVPGRFLNGRGETWRGSVRTGARIERPFVFAETNLPHGSKVNRDAGTIMLKIRMIQMDGEKLANPVQQLPNFGSESSMMGHCIGLGAQRNTYQQSPATWKVKPSDGNRSHVTFVFRYRPQAFLESQNIISAEEMLRIPPAVQAACRRVASTENSRSERMGSGSQNAINSRVPVHRVPNVRTGNSQQIRYPSKSVL